MSNDAGADTPDKAARDKAPIEARRAADAQAAALLLKGNSGEEIAAAIGLGTPREALKSASRGLAQTSGMPTSTSRALDVARTNVAIAALWPRVEAGQPDAAAALAALLDVRMRLLGLTDASAPDAAGSGSGRRRGKGGSGSGSGESDQLSLDS